MTRKTSMVRGVLALAVFPSLPEAAPAVLYGDITAVELKSRMDDESDTGFVILDIREKESYKGGRIPGAMNIPLGELGYRFSILDKTKDVIVYCDVGLRSKVACRVLANAGFKDVYNLTGGLRQWNYPIETGNGSVSI